VSDNEVISISKCEIELIRGTKTYRGKPVSARGAGTEQVAKLTTFRVTSSDELNLIVGLVEWPTDPPEVKPIDLIGGLTKHSSLARRGSMSLSDSRDGNWLAVLKVMKYSPDKGYFTLHGATANEIDSYLGYNFKELALEMGALRFGTRAEIENETSRTANQLAMVVPKGDLRALAFAYTVTRALAVINDFGLEA
tara:strand:+ start:276 stop:860 length:585 start_codon:yes stop_codon:yes gene_type:complete